MINPYPRRLLRCMQYVAVLSDSEAKCAVRDWRAGYIYSGEAVNHYGGTLRVIKRAIESRHKIRELGVI